MGGTANVSADVATAAAVAAAQVDAHMHVRLWPYLCGLLLLMLGTFVQEAVSMSLMSKVGQADHGPYSGRGRSG